MRTNVMMLALLTGVAVCAAATVVDVTPEQGLAAARDAVRARRAEGETGPITVRLAAGRYAVTRPLELDARDGAVEWTAAPGAEVRISGGCLVTASPAPVTDPALVARLPEAARGKVVQFDLKTLGVTDLGDYLYNHEDAIQRRVATTWGQGEFTMGSHPPPAENAGAGRLEFFADDRPMTVARTPTNRIYHVDRLLGKIRRTGPGGGTVASAEARFTVAEDFPAGWEHEPDAHLCGCWCRDWAEQHQRIVRYDRATRTVELSKPWHQYLYKTGTEFFGFNLLCELDEPGEWYVERVKGLLLTWLPAGARRLELSVAPRLVELRGTTNVVFRGLVFEACRNSAVYMKDCAGCRLERCTVRNVGHHALVVEDGSASGARDCAFYGMGGGGAFLVDGNRATLEPSGHFVERCDIHDFGRWNRMYRPGVCLAGIGQRAVGNRIHDAPHAAILFFGCELLMQSNEVYRVNRETKDCGAFYSGRSWLLRGNRILDNSFHDIIGLRGAYTRTIYLDDSMADTLIAGNRFERCTWAIFIGGSRENVITNNVFVDCPNAFYMDDRGRGWQKPHINGRLGEMRAKGTLHGIPFRTGVYAARYPALKDLPGPDPYSPIGNVLAHNVFDRGRAEWLARYGRPGLARSPDWWHDCLPLEEVAALGVLRNNVVDGKPQNFGVWYAGPDGGAFGDPANWPEGVLPKAGDRVMIPRGRTVVVRAADWAAFTNTVSLHLGDVTAAIELRDISATLPPGRVQLSGKGTFRAVGTGATPCRLTLRQDNARFAGSFFFTNVSVEAVGPATLGRAAPVTFCKTTQGPDCVFAYVAPGVYSSDVTFVPPEGNVWYAVSAVARDGRKGTVVNRGRLVIPLLVSKRCGRISAQGLAFVQEGLLDLGARIDLCGDVTLKCPMRYRGNCEELFTDDAAGCLRFGEGFSWGAGAPFAESFARLVEPDVLGPWKKLVGTSEDPGFAARVRTLLPAEWKTACTARDGGRTAVIVWRDPTAPQ